MPEDSRTIENAFARARDRKPAYEEFYPFLEQLFLAQEKARDTLDPEIHVPASSRVQAQWKEGFPLLKRWEFPVNVRSAEEIREVLGKCLPPGNLVMRAAFEALAGGLDRHREAAEEVWRSFLQHDGEPWEKQIDAQGVDTASLLFLARSCLRPSIEWTAQQLLGRFPLPEAWLRGYCPVCGSLPSLLVLKGEGERKGYCSWCATHWGVNRMQCPNCDNRDHESLGYLYAEEDPLYRAQYCRLCKFYFKVIDARDSSVALYLPLEEWTTLHLDMLAQKSGWTAPPSPSPAVYGSP
ncbi:MAG: formate dehydrogenase accessory protein FdhE [Deltaproteobacteria bacterium]|nr:formate dehydrogenase accessory protein FdhE [Deltaproteobacteria bacterium]